jgi:hypothetical protein
MRVRWDLSFAGRRVHSIRLLDENGSMGRVGFEPSVRILSSGFMLISYREYELTFSDFRVIEKLQMYFIIYSHFTISAISNICIICVHVICGGKMGQNP